MRRVVVSLLLILLLLVAASPTAYGVDARTSIPEGMCSLWTTRQATNAMGEPMEVVRDDPDFCVWYGKKPHSGSISTLSAGLRVGDPWSDESLLDQARGQEWRGWSEATVGGVPMLMTKVDRSGKNREITAAAFPDPTTWLDLNAYSVIGKDVRRAVRRMVEIAAPKLAATTPSIAPAQSTGPVVDACALLTEDEVSAALGETLVANAMPPACLFAGPPASGTPTNLGVVVLRGAEAASAIAQFAGLGFTESTVGGVPAHQSPPDVSGGRSRSVLAVVPDPSTVLALSVDVPEAIDAAAAAQVLAELALPRLAAVPTPSTAVASTAPASPAASVPAPSIAPLSGLAALYPTEIGGRPVTLDREMTGQEFLSQIIAFPTMERRVTRALERRDLSVDDLSFAIGGTPSGSTIVAFRVEGGRIRPLVNTLLESLAMERTGQEIPAETVAGKEAFEVTGGFLISGQGIAYAAGEVLWLVFPEGDEQSEIFEKLP